MYECVLLQGRLAGGLVMAVNEAKAAQIFTDNVRRAVFDAKGQLN